MSEDVGVRQTLELHSSPIRKLHERSEIARPQATLHVMKNVLVPLKETCTDSSNMAFVKLPANTIVAARVEPVTDMPDVLQYMLRPCSSHNPLLRWFRDLVVVDCFHIPSDVGQITHIMQGLADLLNLARAYVFLVHQLPGLAVHTVEGKSLTDIITPGFAVVDTENNLFRTLERLRTEQTTFANLLVCSWKRLSEGIHESFLEQRILFDANSVAHVPTFTGPVVREMPLRFFPCLSMHHLLPQYNMCIIPARVVLISESRPVHARFSEAGNAASVVEVPFELPQC
mmetsp:Transcript_48417/g.98873  ORF Transcript_48417/g.98873 Transcript_48417/m.98873 type:complete len:286 (-) Transcript_48417:865-1722(-)